jgi:hypothetical protein
MRTAVSAAVTAASPALASCLYHQGLSRFIEAFGIAPWVSVSNFSSGGDYACEQTHHSH